MSDEDVRDAERRWRASGSVEDQAAWLRARVRAGALPLAHVHAAAFLGHEAARRVEPAPWPEDGAAARSPSVSETEGRLYDLWQHAALGPAVAREWLCRCVEHVLHLFERDAADDPRPRAALAAARRYLRGEVGEEALALAAQEARQAGVDVLTRGGTYAARGVAFEAEAACFAPDELREVVPASAALDALRDAGLGLDAVEAEARWQAAALLDLLLA